MKERIVIINNTDFSMISIYEYLAGYTTRLADKIGILDLDGKIFIYNKIK